MILLTKPPGMNGQAFCPAGQPRGDNMVSDARYDWHRPHASLGQKAPISLLGLNANNLMRHHI